MGTEVHCNMYLPECYSMREFNGNSRSSNWPLHQENEIPQNGRCRSIVSVCAAPDGYCSCDKEKLRETILKHESIFRHQVVELHRLYERQRDLVDNLKNNVKEQDVETEATRSNLFPCPIYSMVDQVRWASTSVALVDPYSGMKLNSDSHLYRERGMIMQSSFQKHEVKLIDDSMDYNCEKPRTKLFGRELPTDDDSTNHGSELKGNNGVALCSALNVKRNHGFPNLNEPADHVEEADFPDSVNTLLSNACSQQREWKKRKIFGVEISETNQNAPVASRVLDRNMCRSYESDSNESQIYKEPISLRHRDCGVAASSLKDLNASEELRHKNQNPLHIVFEDREDRTQGTPQWFRTMPLCNGLPSDKGQHPYQMNLESLHERFQKLYNKDVKLRKDPIENPIQDSSLATIPHYAADKVKANERSSKGKIIDCHVSRENHSWKGLTSLKSTVNDSGKSDIIRSSSSQGLVDKNVTRLTIDLNLSFEEEIQFTVNSPSVKLGDEKDMEGPAVGVEYVEEDNSSLSDDALIKFAAESLINISSSLSDDHDESSAAREKDDSIDSLHWFAEVATSQSCDIQIATNHNDCNTEELDDFELLTLNLQATKIEELSYLSPISLCENKSEETAVPKQTRKGQTRRGRQHKKDFQRDILPSVSCLSRNEVRDDILTMEGLVKSSGGCWQSSLTLKCRNDKGRGRKRSVTSTPSAAAPDVCLPQIEESSLTGWGKRTRRLPRQRYLVQNHSIAIKRSDLDLVSC